MDDGTIRLLCTGDLHLGRHPTRIPDRLDGPELSPRSVWRDVVREAVDQSVDAVVLTGDIADRENRYFEAYGAFEAGVIDLEDAGIPVVTVAGNHDSEFLPRMIDDVDLENVHFLGAGGTWERWTLERDGSAALHFDGWSFPEPHPSVSPLDAYDLPTAVDAPQVGVLHADLDAPRSRYAPVTTGELRDTPASAWLLGHIHVPGVRIESDPLILYPGSPQPLDPGERGVHGPWTVTIEPDGAIDAEQVPLGTVCYDEIEVDAAGVSDLQAVVPEVSAAIRRYVRGALETRNTAAFLARVRLTGRTPAHAQLVEAGGMLAEQVATTYESIDVGIESVVVDTRPDIDLESATDGDGPVSYLAELLVTLESEGTSERYTHVIDEAHAAMRRAHGADAYDLLRREASSEQGDGRPGSEKSGRDQPERDEAVEALKREARTLIDTLRRQKEDRQ